MLQYWQQCFWSCLYLSKLKGITDYPCSTTKVLLDICFYGVNCQNLKKGITGYLYNTDRSDFVHPSFPIPTWRKTLQIILQYWQKCFWALVFTCRYLKALQITHAVRQKCFWSSVFTCRNLKENITDHATVLTQALLDISLYLSKLGRKRNRSCNSTDTSASGYLSLPIETWRKA